MDSRNSVLGELAADAALERSDFLSQCRPACRAASNDRYFRYVLLGDRYVERERRRITALSPEVEIANDSDDPQLDVRSLPAVARIERRLTGTWRANRD